MNSNELQTAKAFTKQAQVFDALYAPNAIVQYKRERVRRHMQPYLLSHSRILELNCGTGEDAVFFAQQGHCVHATDVSEGMQHALLNKIEQYHLQQHITTELCSFTQLEQLNNKGPFDVVFSNFGGLNCTGELYKTLDSLSLLLKPGGVVTLVIISKFCLWETLLLLKGKFKTATRRFFSSKGRLAHVEGYYFNCWYYKPSYVAQRLKNFQLLSLEGLCTIVPPSYMEGFSEKHPKFYRFLQAKEEQLKSAWPWKYIGDYYIISLQKVQEDKAGSV